MPKRRVTGLTDWISRFGAIPIQRQQIEALWEEVDPILTLENASYILQVMDSAGNLHSLMNTSGQVPTVDINGGAQVTRLESIYDMVGNATGYFGALPSASSTAVITQLQKRIRATNITLVGGVVTNVELVPAVAGYTGYMQPYALWASDDDEYALVFQDEDDAPLNPTNCDSINVQIKHDNEISPIVQTHGAAGDNSGSSASNILFYGIADNKALEVDVSGGAGGETLVLYYEFWYET